MPFLFMKNASKIIALLWLLLLSASEGTLILFFDYEQKFHRLALLGYQEEHSSEEHHLHNQHAANCQDETSTHNLRLFAKNHRGENDAQKIHFYCLTKQLSNWIFAEWQRYQHARRVLLSCFSPTSQYLFLVYKTLII